MREDFEAFLLPHNPVDYLPSISPAKATLSHLSVFISSDRDALHRMDWKHPLSSRAKKQGKKYMKRIATLLPLIITSMSIQAGNSDVYCEKIAQVADMAMEFRQMNMPMSYQLEEVPDGAIIIRKIIMDAYEKPGYSSKPMRFEAQMKFRNDWHLQCLKADKAWE